jgi:hypothetical protein
LCAASTTTLKTSKPRSIIAIRRCADISVLTEANGEKVVLVQEVERTYRYRLDICEIEACIREAVINEHEIALDAIVLVGPGTIPKTTSGKIQRARTRQLIRVTRCSVVSQPLRPAYRPKLARDRAQELILSREQLVEGDRPSLRT